MARTAVVRALTAAIDGDDGIFVPRYLSPFQIDNKSHGNRRTCTLARIHTRSPAPLTPFAQ
jgi:hypothetical protein